MRKLIGMAIGCCVVSGAVALAEEEKILTSGELLQQIVIVEQDIRTAEGQVEAMRIRRERLYGAYQYSLLIEKRDAPTVVETKKKE